MDNSKEWISLPMPGLLTAYRKDSKRISAESSVMLL